jgi:hypothetical protein
MHYIVKKTLKVFLDSQNNYVVKVKANQPTLLGSIKEIIENLQLYHLLQTNKQNEDEKKKE